MLAQLLQQLARNRANSASRAATAHLIANVGLALLSHFLTFVCCSLPAVWQRHIQPQGRWQLHSMRQRQCLSSEQQQLCSLHKRQIRSARCISVSRLPGWPAIRDGLNFVRQLRQVGSQAHSGKLVLTPHLLFAVAKSARRAGCASLALLDALLTSTTRFVRHASLAKSLRLEQARARSGE